MEGIQFGFKFNKYSMFLYFIIFSVGAALSQILIIKYKLDKDLREPGCPQTLE